jgi:hypothetical protein
LYPPKRVTDDEERNVHLVRVPKNLVRLKLDRLARSRDHRAAVERLELLLLDHKDRGVRLEVDALALLDGLRGERPGVKEYVNLTVLTSRPLTVMSFSSLSPRPIT